MTARDTIFDYGTAGPFGLISAKQKVGAEYTAEVELFVLLHFDAAKRGRCTAQGYNFISRHLVQAQYIFARLKADGYLDVVRAAGNAWSKAGVRPGEYASLTTAEYQAMRAGLKAYFKALPRVETGTYRQACNVADQVMG